MNKLLSKYIFTGSVVFNVKSMNNIDNIKNFDKIKEINNIENRLKETNLVINKFIENVFVESLNICDFSKIKNIILDRGRCKIEDGELSYKDFQYLHYKNNIDSYKNNVDDIFKGKSLFFYQIDDCFLQYVQLNFLNTIFNINEKNNIFRKLLNLHLDLSKDNKYLFYDFLDEKTSQDFTYLKIENIVKNIEEYLKSKKYIEYYYLNSDYFKKKNDKFVVGLTYSHNNIFSIGVVQGLTYCKNNFLFEYLDKTPINGFSDLIIEILNNNVIFDNLKIIDKDLLKNVNNIDKYVFLYQNIKNFIDINTHEFDHFMYDIYQDIFDYYSKLNTKESVFLSKYKEFYSIFGFHNISDLYEFSDNYLNNFKLIMNEFLIFLDYYSNNNDFKNIFIKNVYKLKYLKSLDNNIKNKEFNISDDLNFYSSYSLEENKITEFFAEIFSKYIVSNISNEFIFELLKIRYFYCYYQIKYFIQNKK